MHEWNSRQITGRRETTSDQATQQARLAPEANAGIEVADQPEMGAANSEVIDEGRTADGGSVEEQPAGARQDMPAGQATPEEKNENGVGPESPGVGHDFQNRFEAAQGRIRNQPQGTEELQALLDQAITLLEAFSRHSAIRDYEANKRQLDEIEQRLGYGSYPQ